MSRIDDLEKRIAALESTNPTSCDSALHARELIAAIYREAQDTFQSELGVNFTVTEVERWLRSQRPVKPRTAKPVEPTQSFTRHAEAANHPAIHAAVKKRLGENVRVFSSDSDVDAVPTSS